MKITDRKITLAAIFSGLIVLLAGTSLSQAQGGAQNQSTPDVVNPPDDYFTVNASTPRRQRHLDHVEKFHVNQIQEHIQQGQMEPALVDLKYTLERYPNHPKALMLAGMLAMLTKSPLLAISSYERALKLYPQHALTRAQYGFYLVNRGQTAKGIKKLQEAVKMAPNLAVAHSWLAKAYIKTGKSELAQQAAKQAAALKQKR